MQYAICRRDIKKGKMVVAVLDSIRDSDRQRIAGDNLITPITFHSRTKAPTFASTEIPGMPLVSLLVDDDGTA